MSPFDRLRQLFPTMLRPTPTGRSATDLAQLLGIEVALLPTLRLGGPYHYQPLVIEKRDGRPRPILAPSPALKQLQRNLHRHWQTQPIHACAFAYRRNSSHLQHARYHSWQRLIATVDLQDFFASTSARRVRGFLKAEGWNGAELATLLRLCLFNGGLPQGAPTSPVLSNLVNRPLDQALQEFARERGALYSRYADDLAFSWSDDHLPPGFTQGVEDILRRFRYTVQPHKNWCITPIAECPIITGIELRGRGRLRLPWAWRWRYWCRRWRFLGDPQTQGYKSYARLVRRNQQPYPCGVISSPYAATISTVTMLPEEHDDVEDEDDIPF